MSQFKIFFAVNNNVLNVMFTNYVISARDIHDAPEVLAEFYPELKSMSYNASIVNDTTRCVVYKDLVAIVELI